MCKLVTVKLNNNNIRVADIKVKAIDNFIDKISYLKGIERAVLFGSALEERCTEESDIDVALFGTMTENEFFVNGATGKFKRELAKGIGLKEVYDILYFKNDAINADSMIMNEIREKGKEIYAV